VDVAEYLPQHGCDQDHAAKSGWTALHYAAQAGNLDVAQLLFRYGAKLDVRTRYNELPADVATASGHPAVAAAIRAEEISRRDRGFRRDHGTEEEEGANKRLRVDEQQQPQEVESDEMEGVGMEG
jgi:ankyrin repeat protein